VDRTGIAVLRILNEENHKECDDCRPRVDDQLPGIRVVEVGSAHDPQDYYEERSQERPLRANPVGGLGCENVKPCFAAFFILVHEVNIRNRRQVCKAPNPYSNGRNLRKFAGVQTIPALGTLCR
jgi:hypothetical protein